MRNLIIPAVFLLLIGTGVSLASANAKENPTAITELTDNVQDSKTVKLKITGMTCGGCAGHVHKVLSETVGVLDNSVEYPGNIAIIEYDPNKISPEEITKTIQEKTNYLVELYKEA